MGASTKYYSRPTTYKAFLWSSRLVLICALLALLTYGLERITGLTVLIWIIVNLGFLALFFFALSVIYCALLKCDVCNRFLYNPWNLLIFDRHPKNLVRERHFSCDKCGQGYFV